jgi:hypothetical protein
MARYRVALILALLFMMAGSAFGQASWMRVSSFTFDWDGHKGVQVALDNPSQVGDPGDFRRIRIRVPGQKEFVLRNDTGWVEFSSGEASIFPQVRKATNRARSQYVLALKVAENRTALLLFG